MYNVGDKAFDAFTKLFRRALPKDSVLPNSFKQMQSIIKQFDLGYKNTDVCPNDCVLSGRIRLNSPTVLSVMLPDISWQMMGR